MSLSLPELAAGYSQAWANHDPDAIVALHTEDAVFHLHDVMEPWVGHDAIRAAAAGLFADQPERLASQSPCSERVRRRARPELTCG